MKSQGRSLSKVLNDCNVAIVVHLQVSMNGQIGTKPICDIPVETAGGDQTLERLVQDMPKRVERVRMKVHQKVLLESIKYLQYFSPREHHLYLYSGRVWLPGVLVELKLTQHASNGFPSFDPGCLLEPGHAPLKRYFDPNAQA